MPPKRMPAFGPNVASKLTELKGNESMDQFYCRLSKSCPAIHLDDKSFTLMDIQNHILDSLPFFSYVPAHGDLIPKLNQLMGDSKMSQPSLTKRIYNELVKLPTPKKTTVGCRIMVVRVQEFPEVTITEIPIKMGVKSGEKALTSKSTGTAPKAAAAKNSQEEESADRVIALNIKLSRRVPPHSFIRINTGLIFKFAKPNDDVILVPEVCGTSNTDFCPNITATDAGDGGLFTIIGYSASGELEGLRVFLNVYQARVNIPSKQFKVITHSPEDAFSHASQNYHTKEVLVEPGKGPMTTCEIFKLKDNNKMEKRFVRNLKVKARFDSGEMSGGGKDLRTVQFKIFNRADGKLIESERLAINTDCNSTVLFVSRKREWFDPHLFTVAGILKPGTWVAPVVLDSEPETHNRNTHCVAVLTSRLSVTLEKKHQLSFRDCKLINGAFRDLPEYVRIEKYLRQLVQNSHTLFVGLRRALTKFKDYDPMEMLRYYDYTRHLVFTKPREQIIADIRQSDEDLYNNYSVANNSPVLSLQIFRGLLHYALLYFSPDKSDRFTEAEYAKLKAMGEKYQLMMKSQDSTTLIESTIDNAKQQPPIDSTLTISGEKRNCLGDVKTEGIDVGDTEQSSGFPEGSDAKKPKQDVV